LLKEGSRARDLHREHFLALFSFYTLIPSQQLDLTKSLTKKDGAKSSISRG
jgi:hypothetical protein